MKTMYIIRNIGMRRIVDVEGIGTIKIEQGQAILTKDADIADKFRQAVAPVEYKDSVFSRIPKEEMVPVFTVVSRRAGRGEAVTDLKTIIVQREFLAPKSESTAELKSGESVPYHIQQQNAAKENKEVSETKKEDE